ncbi:tail needle knob protein, partial [Escherichia coli]|nr:tail needle knob protein [Escherichia coli]
GIKRCNIAFIQGNQWVYVMEWAQHQSEPHVHAIIMVNERSINALEYATTRKKSEVVYSGVSVTIPTAPTNLVSLLKTLTPSS